MQHEALYLDRANQSLTPVGLRFLAYAAGLFALTASLPYVVQDGGFAIFQENGPIEWIQFSLLVGTAAIFVAGASGNPAFRETFLLLASFSAFASTRELDKLLDEVIPVIGWKIGFVLMAWAAYWLYIHRQVIHRQTKLFLFSPPFALLWAGFIVAVPVAQLLGHGSFLKALMEDDYNPTYKRVIEESGELLGYFLLMAGSIESVLSSRLPRKKPQG